MADDFKILIHRSSNSLHLKPVGDFNERSAEHLFHVLKENVVGISRVFIHTNCMGTVDPSGRNLFQRYLSSLNGGFVPLVFTGENASQLAPEDRGSIAITS